MKEPDNQSFKGIAMLIRKLVFALSLPLILSQNAYSACSGNECMEVKGPRIPNEGGATTIGGIIGRLPPTGGSGPAATAVSLTSKGKDSAKKAKDKKKKEGKADETNIFDILLGIFAPTLEIRKIAIDTIKEIFSLEVTDNEKIKIIKKDPETGVIIEERTIESCKSIQINDKSPSCTEIKMNKFKDPSDGRDKMLFTISEVESMKNPLHGIFIPPYIFKYVNSFQFVAESEQDIDSFFSEIE